MATLFGKLVMAYLRGTCSTLLSCSATGLYPPDEYRVPIKEPWQKRKPQRTTHATLKQQKQQHTKAQAKMVNTRTESQVMQLKLSAIHARMSLPRRTCRSIAPLPSSASRYPPKSLHENLRQQTRSFIGNHAATLAPIAMHSKD